jgi:hypothetical protein
MRFYEREVRRADCARLVCDRRAYARVVRTMFVAYLCVISAGVVGFVLVGVMQG